MKTPSSFWNPIIAYILFQELRNLVKDNKQLTDTLAEMNRERLLLQNRVAELENRQPNRIPIDDLEARVIVSKLTRQFLFECVFYGLQADYLFAKLMRSESHRKALVWQKRYLTSLLKTYQDLPYQQVPVEGSSKSRHAVQTNLQFGVGSTVSFRGQSRFR